MTIIVQDPTHLAQILEEGLDHAIEGLGMQIWMDALRKTQLMGNMNMISTQELGELMGQTFQSLSFFPFYPFLPGNQSLKFVPFALRENINPSIQSQEIRRSSGLA